MSIGMSKIPTVSLDGRAKHFKGRYYNVKVDSSK